MNKKKLRVLLKLEEYEAMESELSELRHRNNLQSLEIGRLQGDVQTWKQAAHIAQTALSQQVEEKIFADAIKK